VSPQRFFRRVCARILLVATIATPVVASLPQRAAAATVTNGKIAYVSNVGSLFVANADGTSPSAVATSAKEPSWSHDGQRLAYRTETGGNYNSIAPDGTGLTTLGQVGVTWPGQGLVWSADGSKVLYWNQTTLPNGGGGAENIFVHDFTNNTDVDVLPRSSTDRFPAWSPDETKIAFQANSAVAPRVWIMDSTGANPHLVPNQPAGNSYFPRFSPDGSKLVFVNQPPDNASMRLFTINIDGTGLVQIGPEGRWSTDATFSPDGTKILFSSSPASGVDDTRGLYVMDVDGTNVTQITHGDHGAARWQPLGAEPLNQPPVPRFTKFAQVSPHYVVARGTTSSDPDGTIASYEWRWGDGGTPGTTPQAWHQYKQAGWYLIRLTVTDNQGATATRGVWYHVN
jgi:Tol biopolymer transport system component